MKDVFGAETMSQTRIHVWHKRFREGHTSFKDEPHTGRPRSVRTRANIDKVSQLLQVDKRKSVREMAEDLDISKTSVHKILKSDLNLSKIAPKLIPKLLTDEQCRFRVQLCEMNLASLRDNPDLMKTVVTGDELWVSVLEIETKQSSCSWMPKGTTEGRPTKAHQQRGARKSMLTAFFDVKGVILSEFLPQGETVTADEYIKTLQRLRENIRRKRPQLWGRGQVRRGDVRPFLLHHDNVSSHTAVPTLAFIGEQNMEMLPHPPYSPDLAPCDFFLFPRLKNDLRFL